MFYLGKALQLSGLVTAPLALAVGIGAADMYGELLLLGIAGGVFLVGSFLVRRSHSGELG